MHKIVLLFSGILATFALSGQTISKEFRIEKKFLNFPIEMNQDRQMVQFLLKTDTITYSVIRISENNPDYWVFKDVSDLTSKNIKLLFQKQGLKGSI